MFWVHLLQWVHLKQVNMWIRSTVDGTTCHGFTCYIGNTCARTTWTLEPLVTGLVEPLGPLMQGLLETPGLTVAGHLVHGQVKEAPCSVYHMPAVFLSANFSLGFKGNESSPLLNVLCSTLIYLPAASQI
jgi:hypothetical protein